MKKKTEKELVNRTKITKNALILLPKDTEYEEYKLEGVTNDNDSWTLKVNSGACLSIPKTGFIPKVGMTAKFYGKGFGYSVRGVVIDETPIFYRTRFEAEQDHKDYCEQQDKEKQKAFKKNKKLMDKEYNALPNVFKKRIDRFRKANPNFRRDYESYEMFTIKEAIKIAKAVKDPNKIKEFYDKPFDEQVKVAGIDEGHSNNTFGCACKLAQWYLEQPELVVLEHGALAPLVGCKAYGCKH